MADLSGDNLIIGTSGADTRRGGAGNDRMYGRLGADRLYGDSGNDDLFGEAGNDKLFGGIGIDDLYGGAGADELNGGDGADKLHGEDGTDLLIGGGGNDILKGGAQNDKLRGGEGADGLYGDNGDDSLFGEDGNDQIYGGAGKDVVRGGSGNDLLKGDSGNDDLQGNDGVDRLYGGIGNDVLNGGNDNDFLYGEAGADTLVGGGGDDVLKGGDDNDTLRGGSGADLLDGQNGNDRLIGESGNDRLFGGNGRDTLLGGDGNDELRGGGDIDMLFGDGGADSLFGDGGNDKLSGGAQNDILRAGAGADELIGGTGDDRLFGNDGNDRLFGEDGADFLAGGNDNDILKGGGNDDELIGGRGNDELRGGTGNDVLKGHVGVDKLYGDDGNDVLRAGGDADELRGNNGDDDLFGDAGNDSLWGGAGNDHLNGGIGVDLLIGNDGADHFVLTPGGVDTLKDFDLAEGDSLGLSGLLTNFDAAKSDILDYVKLERDYQGQTVQLLVDANGRAGGEDFKAAATINSTIMTHVSEIVAAGALSVDGVEVPEQSARPAQPTGNRAKTETFLDSLGVNVQLNAEISTNAELQRYINSLDYLGIDNVRTQAVAINDPFLVNAHERLAEEGIEFTFLMRKDFPDGGQKQLNEYAAFFTNFLKDHPGSIDAFEGLNEVGDASTRDISRKEAENFQKLFYNTFKSKAALDDIPIYMFTVWFGREAENFEGFANLSDYADFANVHSYVATGLHNHYELINRIDNTEPLTGDLPSVITETGYNNGTKTSSPLAVSESVQAKLTLNTVANTYAQGVEKTFLYELFDNDGSSLSDHTTTFGMFSETGRAKPAADALHNLTSILGDESGSANHGKLNVEIIGGDEHTHSLVLKKDNGATNIIVWRDALIWDSAKKKEIVVDPISVEVDLNKNVKRIEVYDPLVSDNQMRAVQNKDSVSLDLTDHVLILEVY